MRDCRKLARLLARSPTAPASPQRRRRMAQPCRPDSSMRHTRAPLRAAQICSSRPRRPGRCGRPPAPLYRTPISSRPTSMMRARARPPERSQVTTDNGGERAAKAPGTGGGVPLDSSSDDSSALFESSRVDSSRVATRAKPIRPEKRMGSWFCRGGVMKTTRIAAQEEVAEPDWRGAEERRGRNGASVGACGRGRAGTEV